jgi:hypothetical protein
MKISSCYNVEHKLHEKLKEILQLIFYMQSRSLKIIYNLELNISTYNNM